MLTTLNIFSAALTAFLDENSLKFLEHQHVHQCHFSLTDQSNQEEVGRMISTLSTMPEEKLILAVTDNPVLYDLTLP